MTGWNGHWVSENGISSSVKEGSMEGSVESISTTLCGVYVGVDVQAEMLDEDNFAWGPPPSRKQRSKAKW